MKGRKYDRSVYRREKIVFASSSCSQQEEEEEEEEVEVKEDEGEVDREKRDVCADTLPL
jgi:hypothetical protein